MESRSENRRAALRALSLEESLAGAGVGRGVWEVGVKLTLGRRGGEQRQGLFLFRLCSSPFKSVPFGNKLK